MANELHETNRNFAQERKLLLEEINSIRSELIRVEALKRELEYHSQGNSSSQTARLNQALQTNNRLEEQIQALKRRIFELEREKKADSNKLTALEGERYRVEHLPAELERLQQQLLIR
jgi:hypothetical protein